MTDAYKNFIEMEADTLPDINVFYATIIATLNEQLNEANEVIENLRTYDFTIDDENAEAYQVKWGIKAERLYKNRKWGVE